MKKNILVIAFLSLMIISCKKVAEKKVIIEEEKVSKSDLIISPIEHATCVLSFNNKIVYIDPTGGSEAFSKFKKPNYVVITDVHGDHMNIKTLKALDLSKTKIIAPKAVADRISDINAAEIIVMNNNEEKTFNSFKIEAIPMYNLRKEALKFHSKGRGNGYVFTINKERIYFSGDTEDIPEMRNLKNIDKAFVCMNLPYTMTVESAVNAVLDFKPKQIYPYHYRGTKGLSDVVEFKNAVNMKSREIEVIQLDWYPNRKK